MADTLEVSIVIGASSQIAKSFMFTIHAQSKDSHIISVSRKHLDIIDEHHNHYICDYSDTAIKQTIQNIKSDLLKQGSVEIKNITIFNGVLHRDLLQPEKKLEDLNPSHLLKVYETNTVVPLMWLSHLPSLLDKKTHTVITALSARVGSIEDNKLGGWYSYRSSKAALNMAFKTASVEMFRRFKKVKLMLFHPGTTDTPLSKPFQANVPKGKLFTSEFVAEQLFTLINNRTADGQLDYIDWQGKPIPW